MLFVRDKIFMSGGFYKKKLFVDVCMLLIIGLIILLSGFGGFFYEFLIFDWYKFCYVFCIVLVIDV